MEKIEFYIFIRFFFSGYFDVMIVWIKKIMRFFIKIKFVIINNFVSDKKMKILFMIRLICNEFLINFL